MELFFGVIPEGGVLPELDEEQAGRVDALKEPSEERGAYAVGGNCVGKGRRGEAGMGVAMSCGR